MLFYSKLAVAQLKDNSVVEFNQFFQNYTALNPASNDSVGKFQLNLGNRTFTGLFEGVNRVYADASLKINHSNTQYSKFGVLINRFNDGEYINRTKAYSRYSWTTRLNSKSSISGGLAIGVVNYTFMPSQAGGGGSSTTTDGNIGVWYLRKKFQFGLSYQQMLQTKITPIYQQFILSPMINFNAIHYYVFNPFIKLTTHAFVNYQNSDYYNIQIAPVFLFYNNFEAGVNAHYQKGYSVLLGVKSISIGIGTIKVMGSYLIRTSQFSNSSDNVFELSAGYSF